MSTNPTAKLAGSRLVLNLPDAETPALWVMDLNDAQTSVIRLEADKGGLFVLKKHSGKGAETIAVYRERDAGTRAMTVAAKALERARGAANTPDAGGQSRFARGFTYFVMVWFLLWTVGITSYLMQLALSPFMGAPRPAATAAATSTTAAPRTGAPAAAPAAKPAQPQPKASAGSEVGVPMSADDFLKNQIKPD